MKKKFWLKIPLPVDKRNRLLVIGYPLLDEVSVYWDKGGRQEAQEHADDALYRAKNSGRNRVVVWRDSQPTTVI
ncbi:7TM-DISM domain-containing protein [Marinobacter sp. SBS5]|uniref:7TM-DISM domain-containing protein n=1 Tax=Marinobacter sp. SBS5 TaxID=3401754 RepID=UPI003AB0BB8B